MQKIKVHSARKQMREVLPLQTMLLLAIFIAPASGQSASIDQPKFHQSLYELHQQIIKDKQLRLVESEGQYNGSAAEKYRYRDTKYFDAANGRLLSHVIRDADKPDVIHIVEVNIYDDNGKIVRDFGSISLPSAPQRPIRTFLNFHRYNQSLHSFRQFNDSGEVTYESCTGLLGKFKVNISLDGADIKPATTSSQEYKTCFEGTESAWADYVVPH